MHWLDWAVMASTLIAIVAYGSYKTRANRDFNSFVSGGKDMNRFTIGLSIMATQASAITFLSTPGQAYESGMGFVQFYFGVPLAMIVISAIFLPIYYKLNVLTAYEYLEQRFDVRIRLFTAFLFLVSRGLAAGITIYAPSIILSTILGWNLELTNILVGIAVIIYTVSGGTKAVSLTQKWQMAIIFLGMFIAFGVILSLLPKELSFQESVDVAGMFNKMNIIDTSIDISNRYTLFSGLTGGLFLALSYFGTDQSQVQRYLGGKSIKESRLGLMFNGLLKVPMQFFILFVGIMVFVFYQFNTPPAFFNTTGMEQAKTEDPSGKLIELENHFNSTHKNKEYVLNKYLNETNAIRKQELKTSAQSLEKELQDTRTSIQEHIKTIAPDVETKDSDYIFLGFVLKYMPIGVVGLLLAVILSAAMSSTAGELNALATTTTVDYYKRVFNKDATQEQYLKATKWLTIIWGVLAILIALSASLFDNLIQLVNVLGSLFYGTILGIFLVAFFFKSVKGRAILIAALIAESAILIIHYLVVTDVFELSYLLYNLIGCGLVILLSIVISVINKEK